MSPRRAGLLGWSGGCASSGHQRKQRQRQQRTDRRGQQMLSPPPLAPENWYKSREDRRHTDGGFDIILGHCDRRQTRADGRSLREGITELVPETNAPSARGSHPNHSHVQGAARCEGTCSRAAERQNEPHIKAFGHEEKAIGRVELLTGGMYGPISASSAPSTSSCV